MILLQIHQSVELFNLQNMQCIISHSKIPTLGTNQVVEQERQRSFQIIDFPDKTLHNAKRYTYSISDRKGY